MQKNLVQLESVLRSLLGLCLASKKRSPYCALQPLPPHRHLSRKPVPTTRSSRTTEMAWWHTTPASFRSKPGQALNSDRPSRRGALVSARQSTENRTVTS